LVPVQKPISKSYRQLVNHANTNRFLLLFPTLPSSPALPGRIRSVLHVLPTDE
jgi:hypothetical protein